LNPITDIFQTLHVTAVAHSRLFAHNPISSTVGTK
jgi:hypothetical protein